MPAIASSPQHLGQPAGRRRAIIACLLHIAVALLLLAGCSPAPEPEPPTAVAAPEPEPVVAAPPPPPALLPAAPTLPDPMTSGSYLSRHLPPNTVAYLRLPNPWASLGDVVGRPSDAAYASVAWRQQLELLKNAVRSVSSKDQWPAGLAEALVYIDGPVEMALLSSERPLANGARVWISAKMRSDDPAPLEQWLQLFQQTPRPATSIETGEDDSDDEATATAGTEPPPDETDVDTGPATAAEQPDAPAIDDQPPVALPSFGASGLTTLDVGLPDPLLLRFDRDQKRLHALVNIGAVQTQSSSIFASLDKETAHPARAHLESLDHSGRGLAAWMDPQVLIPHVPANELEARSILELGTSWAFAVGTVNGHGQISLSVGGVDQELMARLPQGLRQLPVTSALDPHWAIALALPGAAEWEALRQWSIARQAPSSPAAEPGAEPDQEDAAQEPTEASAESDGPQSQVMAEPNLIDQIDALMRAATGISATTVFSRIGPELVIWEDSAGRFAAVRVKDPDGFDSLLEYMSRQLSGVLKMRRWNGMDIHEFSFLLQPQPQAPSADASSGEIDESRLVETTDDDSDSIASQAGPGADADAPATPPAADEQDAESGWFDTVGRLRGRVYWVVEEQFLVAAKLPQVLADRQFSREKTTLQRWLKDDQARDPAGSIALATAVSDNLQRDSYHGMISVLQNLGDLLEVEVDPYAFPNADELRLPERGAISARLGIDGDRLSLALSYEDSPGELLQGPGGLATVAAAGLVTAVALPAIEDYRARAQLRQTLTEAAELRAQISAYVERRKRWPRRVEDLQSAREDPDDALPGELSWQLESNHLLYVFALHETVHVDLRGRRLVLRLADGQWQCDLEQGDIAERLALRVCADLDPVVDDAVATSEQSSD